MYASASLIPQTKSACLLWFGETRRGIVVGVVFGFDVGVVFGFVGSGAVLGEVATVDGETVP